MRTMVPHTVQLSVIGAALRGSRRQVNFRAEPMQKYALTILCALALACDALPKFQLRLQSDIQREFDITNAMVMVVDTTYMVVAIFDDAHATDEGKELAAFQEQVARYAVTHYHRSRLRTVGIMVGRATRRGSDREPEPTLFLPEYHPDGTVRLALVPSRRAIPRRVQRTP
jgi:hypothetical protein